MSDVCRGRGLGTHLKSLCCLGGGGGTGEFRTLDSTRWARLLGTWVCGFDPGELGAARPVALPGGGIALGHGRLGVGPGPSLQSLGRERLGVQCVLPCGPRVTGPRVDGGLGPV